MKNQPSITALTAVAAAARAKLCARLYASRTRALTAQKRAAYSFRLRKRSMKHGKKILALAAAAAITLSGCGAATSSSSSAASSASGAASSVPASSSASSSAAAVSSLKLDNSKWSYDSDNQVYWQIGVVYCASPEDTAYESMGIYVPAAYMTAADNGDGTYTCTVNPDGAVGSFTGATAPMVIPVETPGYAASPAPTEYSYDSISAYMLWLIPSFLNAS